MTDKEFRDLQGAIKVHVERWVARFGLGTWKLHVRCERDSDEFSPPRHDGGVRNYTSARTSTNWQYMEATLSFNMPQLFDQNQEEVEEIVIHELTHVLVAELRETSDDWLNHEERVVTMLTRAFQKTRDAALQVVASRTKRPKKAQK